MKLKSYKYIGFLFAAFFISSLQAQKNDKRFSENFKVNKNVELVINASNADINVTTWNRNEVAVDAVITVEGLSKRDAQEFFKSWNFEALGNKSKVEINANGNNFSHFNNANFNLNFANFRMPEITIPEFDMTGFEMPEFVMPDFDMPEIDIPDFDDILSDIDDYDFDEYNDDVKTFNYQSKGKNKKIVIKSKKEWDAFKNSKDYEEMKSSIKKSLQKIKMNFNNVDKKKIEEQLRKAKIKYEKVDKKKIKEQIRKAKLAYKKIDKQKIEESLAKAKQAIEKMNLNLAKIRTDGSNVIIIEDGDSKKKIKITRKITIKVPKNATFKLNTRHSKVKLPKGKVSGKVSYGSFNVDEMNGGDLNIYYSPVDVKILRESTLSLNNITDATIASVINTKLLSNSSELKIKNIGKDVNLTSKFGKLTIEGVNANFQNLSVFLDYCEAVLPFGSLNANYEVDTEKSNFKISSKIAKGNTLKKNFFKILSSYKTSVNGDVSSDSKTDNLIKLTSRYSTLNIQ